MFPCLFIPLDFIYWKGDCCQPRSWH